jgi:hypothetical protein
LAKTVYSAGYEGAPEKIVIVAGPSFGQAVKFMLFGAAVGAAAYHFLSKSKERELAARPAPADPLKIATSAFSFLKSKVRPKAATTPAASTADLLKNVGDKYEAAVEDFSADAGKEAPDSPPAAASVSSSPEAIADRISSLTSRLKSLGSRAKDLVENASEAVKPTLENAVAEGKRAAAEVQTRLKKDVDEAGDRPAIAEQDGELPSEKEDKFIE